MIPNITPTHEEEDVVNTLSLKAVALVMFLVTHILNVHHHDITEGILSFTLCSEKMCIRDSSSSATRGPARAGP